MWACLNYDTVKAVAYTRRQAIAEFMLPDEWQRHRKAGHVRCVPVTVLLPPRPKNQKEGKR
jgi:hypothetical protein